MLQEPKKTKSTICKQFLMVVIKKKIINGKRAFELKWAKISIENMGILEIEKKHWNIIASFWFITVNMSLN